MIKNELYDIINEEIRDFKYGVNHFLVTEELNESDRDEIRKIIGQEVSDKSFLIYSRKEKLGVIMKNLLIETRLFEGKVNEDSNGRTLVKGILQKFGAPNQNERVYPKEILMRDYQEI